MGDYEYMVNGSTGNITAELNAALSHSGTPASPTRVYVPGGTYTLTGHVYFASNTLLYGAGAATIFTAEKPGAGSPDGWYLYILNQSNVTMKSFMTKGYCAVRGECGSGTAGNWTFIDVHETASGQYVEAAFWMYVRPSATIDGISFLRCSATHTAAWGFLLFGDDNKFVGNSLIKNVVFDDCEASYCGEPLPGTTVINQWLWSVGFDLVECTTVQNVTVINCRANYNYCAGFHVEYNFVNSKNIRFIDCEANYNGQRPDHPQYYGAGFRFQTFQVPMVTCIRCSGVGNYEGLSYIQPKMETTLDMKTWMNQTAGRASSGLWYPSGAPDKDNNLFFTKNGSNMDCIIDTEYKTWKSVGSTVAGDYYSGRVTFATPVDIYYDTVLSLVIKKDGALVDAPVFPTDDMIAEATLLIADTGNPPMTGAPVKFHITNPASSDQVLDVVTDSQGRAILDLKPLLAGATTFGDWTILARFDGS